MLSDCFQIKIVWNLDFFTGALLWRAGFLLFSFPAGLGFVVTLFCYFLAGLCPAGFSMSSLFFSIVLY